MLSLVAIAVGCTGNEQGTPSTKTPAEDHSGHSNNSMPSSEASDGHGSHENMSMARPRKLVVSADPSQPKAGSPTKLFLQIQDNDGTPIKKYDVLHEKVVHLIVVRDGLDEFAHLHPKVDGEGTITVEFAFPKSGKYRLFADHQPQGKTPGLAIGELNVAGNDEPAPALVPSDSNEIAVDKIVAYVAMTPGGQETLMRFHLTDTNGQTISDLQPYLGAMGHLVIISEDGREYVHAHPLKEGTTSPDGAVEFAAHFPRGGLYKSWGQFQRGGAVFTVPFVMEYKAIIGKAHGNPAKHDDHKTGKEHGHSHERGKMLIADAGPYHALLTAHLAAAGNELDIFFETPVNQDAQPMAIAVESFQAQATTGDGESQTLTFEPAPPDERPAGEKPGSYSHFIAKAPWMNQADDLLVVAKFTVDGEKFVARWKNFVPAKYAHHVE